MASKPYVGNVGSGKSLITEKLVDVTGRSSAASTAMTKISEVYELYDGSMLICDTPGSNAMVNKSERNLHIAHAFNFLPVSCVLLVVKADIRQDTVLETVKDYCARFQSANLPQELLGVCITHMDQVAWTKGEMLAVLQSHLNIVSAVFLSHDTPKEVLKKELLFECSKRTPTAVNVDDTKFQNLFYNSSSQLKEIECSKKVRNP